jgi:hypothetical protein
MGILDDAIREHLELKRQHGVPDEELRRQEEEALGPARRDVAPQHEESADGAAADAELFDMDQPEQAETALMEPGAEEHAVAEPELLEVTPVDGDSAAEPDAELPAAVEPTPVEPPPVEEAPAEPAAVEPTVFEPPPIEPPPVEPPPVEPEPAPEDEVPVGEPGHDPDEPAGEEPFRSHDDEPLHADPEHDELDVLEDTPDFLQETPEHDRLWFEQKPPRDFDFD